MAGQKPPDKTLYPYNTQIWQPSWCYSTLSIMSLNWYKCYILSCYVTTDYLVFTCVHSFLYFPLRCIGQGLSLDRAVFPGNYRPGISRIYISQPMFTLVLVLGVSVLDVLEYLIGENAKYLYLYLITSTWSIWLLDQLYLTPTLICLRHWAERVPKWAASSCLTLHANIKATVLFGGHFKQYCKSLCILGLMNVFNQKTCCDPSMPLAPGWTTGKELNDPTANESLNFLKVTTSDCVLANDSMGQSKMSKNISFYAT